MRVHREVILPVTNAVHVVICHTDHSKEINWTNCVIARCSTGEAWPDIMMSAVADRPCDPGAHSWNYTEYGELYITDPEKRCGSIITYVYFMSFIFLCSFIMLNIVVAVITDRYAMRQNVTVSSSQGLHERNTCRPALEILKGLRIAKWKFTF